ncbi:zinc finger domain-containing protein [Pochonia chlamydosporia 170]|uniref:Zinc finger domain-containing protein n=1 Tax=Pochonia chlamydosporia 170 TaxID=1380566 RepID=A0A219APF1_METCM|nr:zinc finger domain-containing protein [Pochonia chlamydosporia 170]OWT42469.1 zinc finger domain-containing protein [Pochonia chlamydosporia 170]
MHSRYIFVTIDGNGLLFRDEWIKKGAEGGRMAAKVLQGAIIAQCGEHSDVEVIAKVVTNIDGLAKTLGRDVSHLRDFALGFTQGGSSFDFVDVDYREGCLSSQITGTWHFRSSGQRNNLHILMGISHDPSYATFLNEVSQDEFCRSRMTMVEGTSTVPELIATNIPSLDLGKQLFCGDTYLSEKNPYDSRRRSWATGLQPAIPETSIAPVNKPSCSSSYADAAKSGSPPREISFLATPKPIASRVSKRHNLDSPSEQVEWNPGPRELDAPIQARVLAMDSRKDPKKLCNVHFLRGPCTKGNRCPFVHDYSPSSEEINAIALLARQWLCKDGQDCKFDECIYGHHCPSIRDNMCMYPYCKFPAESHPPGTKV